jgi:hypothetical protein
MKPGKHAFDGFRAGDTLEVTVKAELRELHYIVGASEPDSAIFRTADGLFFYVPPEAVKSVVCKETAL